MRQTKSGAALKTIRETKSSDITLRLVQIANAFVGLAIKGQEIKAREDGADADDVWRRIHDAAARLNPLFIGYSSARARFLYFFPEGFAGAAYLGGERDYKLKAKETLDKAAPLAAFETDAQFGEGVLSAFNKTNLLWPSNSFAFAISCTGQTLTPSCACARLLPSASERGRSLGSGSSYNLTTARSGRS